MNELIIEIARQAHIETTLKLSTFADGDWLRLYNQKFSELLIEECINCATWVGKHNKTSVPPANTAHAIGIRIKKQFGIE